MHKKQTGGAGQYACVIGHIEPMEMDGEPEKDIAFESVVRAGRERSEKLHPAIERGSHEALEKSTLHGDTRSLGCAWCCVMGHSMRSARPSSRSGSLR
jgi:elongation factor G